MKRWEHAGGGTRRLPVAMFAMLLGCASTVDKTPEEATPPAADVEETDLSASIKVLSREMPSTFWISDELAPEKKVVRENVSMSDHMSEGMREGASGGAQLGLQFGIVYGMVFPPLLALTPVLALGGAVVGAAGGTIVGAGVGGAKEANSVAMAMRSEREIAYASLNALAVAAAQRDIDFERPVPGPELNSGNLEPDVVDYLLWIRVSSVRIETKKTASGTEESERICIVRVDADTELQKKSDRGVIWRSRYRAEHRYPGDERSAAEEALRQSGREIAVLTLAGLKSGSFARDRAQFAGRIHRHGGASIAGSETVPATRFPGKVGSLQYFGGGPGSN